MSDDPVRDHGRPPVFDDFIAADPETLRIRQYALVLSGCRDPLVISGEVGTGKTLLARMIHRAGGTPGPFLLITEPPRYFPLPGWSGSPDSPSLPEGGTLCLPLARQTMPGEAEQKSLLRFLETGSFRTSETGPRAISGPRLIFESTRPLASYLGEGGLMAELYYHLTAHEINLPPLRDRPEDILLLARHFLSLKAWEDGGKSGRLSARTEAYLRRYFYPENVKELKKIIFERCRPGPGGWIKLEQPLPRTGGR